MITGALFTLGDYARFVGEISDSRALNSSHAERRDAEAVVVLTGGANRISAGLKLLRENHGRRLLISGVSATTTRSDLGRILNDNIMMFGCCIDLDREARDTRGNAVQTAEWVRLHRFQKILLVTSSYHMPRSLMLLQEATGYTTAAFHGYQSGGVNSITGFAYLRLDIGKGENTRNEYI